MNIFTFYPTTCRLMIGLAIVLFMPVMAAGEEKITPVADTPDLLITAASVRYNDDLDLFVFEMQVEGSAGRAVPQAKGKMDGAPVLGYVFPTTLHTTDVGFSATEGILALAVTSHPDFDDTPLWDENNDGDYVNDGIIWHTHWVVLTKDERPSGGLAVKQFAKTDAKVVLPPTNPGMPMYMDSPGFNVVLRGNILRVPVPAFRMNNRRDFRFDAVAAYMQVAQSGDRPMLGVYKVYSVLSGDLSLPYAAK
jgi:hypothetical protein